MSEGDTVSAEVQVVSGIVLDRSVIVTVQTVDGTATGMVVWLGLRKLCWHNFEHNNSLLVWGITPA